MGPLIPEGPRTARYPYTPRFSGVAATEPTIGAFAAYFLLDRCEVHAMHLMSYDGSALTVPSHVHATFDPQILDPGPGPGQH
jgi:hypothetical protein